MNYSEQNTQEIESGVYTFRVRYADKDGEVTVQYFDYYVEDYSELKEHLKDFRYSYRNYKDVEITYRPRPKA